MAKQLRALLSADRVSSFHRHFSLPNDVHLSLLADKVIDMERTDESTIVFSLLSIAEGRVRFPLYPLLRAVIRHWGLILSQPNVNFYQTIMEIVELNRCLRLNLGIPTIRHCYALAKSSGRQRRSFLRAKDTGHHLVTMLASFGKRVDDVMVVVRGNWEFGEGEDRQDLMPRRRGKPGRAAHILLRYEPTYTTFSTANNIPIPRSKEHLTALVFPSFKNLRQIGFEASDSEPVDK
ncbi:hypothetical protein CsSME_00020647 [Camellia sinensis var. sinensis]